MTHPDQVHAPSYDRMHLPNRRGLMAFEVTHNEQVYFVGVGHLGQETPGTPIEVFVQAKITSSESESLARDAAILISFALQYRASAESLASAMTRDDQNRPSTVIGAVLDEVARLFPAST